MKTIKNILAGVTLGVVMGWALGFLRLPYLEKNYSFLLGFIACLAFVALAIIIIFVWKKNSQLLSMLGKESANENLNKPAHTYTFVWIAIAAFIVAGVLLSSFLIHRQTLLFETITQNQNNRIQEQSELFESARRSNMIILLNDILEKVDEDLKNNLSGTLSDKTIASIVTAFNYTFIPYSYLDGDSLSRKKLSPEKGQLLLALFKRNIDSISFNKIKLNAHFSGADLRKADLHGVDLSDADLKDADISNADLSSANFNRADLMSANLWGAKANQVNLVGADLRRANLCWAELNGAQLDSANLNGADLSNAQLRNADLFKAKCRTAILDGTLLNESNMEGVTLIDASLKKTNMSKVNLTKADVNRANFNEAIMAETNLTQILNVDKDWFEKLNQWHVIGAKEIQENYKIVVYTVIEDVSWYRLEKK